MSAENKDKELAVIIMGSGGDEKHADLIAAVFDIFGVECAKRVGSAHKTPEYVLQIVKQYDSLPNRRIAYITIAGRSNALSAFVDHATLNPVTAAPPYSEKYGGMDMLSSLRVPSGIATAVAIEAEAAALHTLKIFALDNPDIRHSLSMYHATSQGAVLNADDKIAAPSRSKGIA